MRDATMSLGYTKSDMRKRICIAALAIIGLAAAASGEAPTIKLQDAVDAALASGDDLRIAKANLDAARAQIMRLIVHHGELEGLLAAEAPQKTQGPSWMRNAAAGKPGACAPRSSPRRTAISRTREAAGRACIRISCSVTCSGAGDAPFSQSQFAGVEGTTATA